MPLFAVRLTSKSVELRVAAEAPKRIFSQVTRPYEQSLKRVHWKAYYKAIDDYYVRRDKSETKSNSWIGPDAKYPQPTDFTTEVVVYKKHAIRCVTHQGGEVVKCLSTSGFNRLAKKFNITLPPVGEVIEIPEEILKENPCQSETQS